MLESSIGYSAKHSDNSERMFMKHLLVSVVIILVCLCSISLSAFAFFTANTTSDKNTLSSANFSLQITSQKDTAKDVSPFEPTLLEAGTYIITLKKQGDATTGFCIIDIEGDSKRYFSRQIGYDANTDTVVDEIKIILVLSKETKVTFTPNWGTSCHYGFDSSETIHNNGTLTADLTALD